MMGVGMYVVNILYYMGMFEHYFPLNPLSVYQLASILLTSSRVVGRTTLEGRSRV